MTIVIALLRGVNLGARRMKMDALRAVCESLKLKNPQTYVQSGNAVFRTAATDLAALSRKLESAIEKEFGFYSETILRTAEDMRAVVAANPFAGRADVLPARLHVHFLAGPPSPNAQNNLAALNKEGEELQLIGHSLYVHYPIGAGQSKISTKLDKALGVTTTARNWNTVLALLEMAQRIS